MQDFKVRDFKFKVYLDDTRPTPSGWVRAYWPNEVISYLKTGKVVELSLDHDLGNDKRGTGYDVLTWLEEQVALHGFVPPVINIHTANPTAFARMWAAKKSIENYHRINMKG
jgi:hypothetical protein